VEKASARILAVAECPFRQFQMGQAEEAEVGLSRRLEV
jgi:hypothetical protein